MKAIKCYLRAGKNDDISVKFHETKVELEEAFLDKLKNEERGNVFVLELGRGYDEIKQTPSFFIDKKKKNKAKPLSVYLLDNIKIPCIETDCAALRQFKNSVRTLIENSRDAHEANIYFVGVIPELYSSILNEATGVGRADEEIKESGDNGAGGEKTCGGHFPGGDDALQADDDVIRRLVKLMSETRDDSKLAGEFSGDSDDAKFTRQMIIRAAQSSQPVLILGETGTGKGIIAKAIHQCWLKDDGRISGETGPKRDKLVTVNCGAISSELFEIELFGAKGGVITGVPRDKQGLWKIAEGGTLFFDEIGDLLPDHQVKILRALQDKKFLPIGALEEEDAKARIIAATNRDLFAMVSKGQFRKDLYYRLSVLRIKTTPLAGHPKDIELLANRYWREITRDRSAALPPDVIEIFSTYKWPGNVREVISFLNTMFSLFQSKSITAEQVRAVMAFQGQFQSPAASGETGGPEFSYFGVERLRHLRNMSEVVHACEEALMALAGGKAGKDRLDYEKSIFVYRLDEIVRLCKDPTLFNSEKTFKAVVAMKRELVDIRDNLACLIADDRASLKARAQCAFDSAHGAIFREIDRITGKKPGL